MSASNHNLYYSNAGIQSSQRSQGYMYGSQASSSAPRYSGQSNSQYQPNYGRPFSSTEPFGAQQGDTRALSQASSSSNTERAAPTLNSLSNLNNAQSASEPRLNQPTTTYASSYNHTAGLPPSSNRALSNRSPLHNTPSSTFRQPSLPDQFQSNSAKSRSHRWSRDNELGTTGNAYANAPSTTAYDHQIAYPHNQPQPPRFASPLQTVQSHQHQQRLATHYSRDSNSSFNTQGTLRDDNAHQQPLHESQRQQTASVEPSPTTVDPSQVYDIRAEQQRKAKIEAERREQIEAARKAEQQAQAAEEARQLAERQAEEDRLQKDKRAAEEETAKKRALQDRKNEQRRKAREEKRQSKTAATALTQMACSSSTTDSTVAAIDDENSTQPANTEEVAMREMFRKMREFNQRNPAMLAKLWEEERRQHATQPSRSTKSRQVSAPDSTSPQMPVVPGTVSKAGASGKSTSPKLAKATKETGSALRATLQAPAVTSQQGSASLWPHHKKDSLAEVAAVWLNGLDSNRSTGLFVEKPEILKILDTNPSYVQLCESIEKVGIRFERSALAKELLKTMPDGMRNQNGRPSTSITPIAGPAALVADAALTADASKRNTGRQKSEQAPNHSAPSKNRYSQNTASGVSYQAPVFAHIAAPSSQASSLAIVDHLPSVSSSYCTTSSGQPASVSYSSECLTALPIGADDTKSSQVNPAQSDITQMEPAPKPPANKEEAARKRTFDDLVDLSKDDSDGEGPPRKIQPHFGAFTDDLKRRQQTPHDGFRRPMNYDAYMRHPSKLFMAPGGQKIPSVSTISTQGSATQPPILPPSVANPSQVPVNVHSVQEEARQQERMRGKMLVEPIMRDRVARKSKYDSQTIARDVLLATGRHPDMRPLNAHLNTMQKLLGDHGGVVDGAGNKSDLATIRWEIIDPGETSSYFSKTMAAKRQGGFANQNTSEANHHIEDFPDHENSAMREAHVRLKGDETEEEKERVWINRMREVALDNELDMIDDLQLRKRLKSRWYQHSHRKGLGSNAKLSGGRAPQASVSASLTAKASRPINNVRIDTPYTPTANVVTASPGSGNMSTGSAMGYAAFRRLDENGNPIKSKGRPVGWRKNIHSREAAGLQPNNTHGRATSHRLHKSVGQASKDHVVEPEYQVFRCKWRSCVAELDNLDKLKKHILKIHCARHEHREDSFQCGWLPCPQDEIGETFDDLASFMKHLNKAHLEHVAKKQGDGPKGGATTEYQTDSESYLSDRQGRSTTPVIRPASEQSLGAMGEASRLSQHLKYSNATGSFLSMDLKEAVAEFKRLEDEKRHQGVTMGQEGSRLATAQRRLGFLDDEDFEDVIVSD